VLLLSLLCQEFDGWGVVGRPPQSASIRVVKDRVQVPHDAGRLDLSAVLLVQPVAQTVGQASPERLFRGGNPAVVDGERHARHGSSRQTRASPCPAKRCNAIFSERDERFDVEKL
jgi:hypothetical protein